jgi:TolB-like protein/Tfp pilus assembly protein PilF
MDKPLRFGPFTLDVRARELWDGASRTRLQDQPFEILRLLLERPGDVVTRDELSRQLWPDGTFVDFEHSLNAAIKRLRAALGDDAECPRYIETVPRRGYRFVGALAPGAPAAAATPPAPVRLAVLPFDNLGCDAAQEYFSDGLTEEMISQLGSLCRGRVGVIARWSSMVFKGSPMRAREIGEALKVEYLLEGSVRREGDRVRITARLVEAAAETHLWSEAYERAFTDCLSVQADVAARIARSLAMELAVPPASGPVAPNAEAYQAYLQGRYYWNNGGYAWRPGDTALERAVERYERALVMAPSFGAAHAALARAQVASGEYYREAPRQALLRARATATRALELDPGAFEAHLALADTRRLLDYDWDGAERAYVAVIASNPSDERGHRAYAGLLAAQGRHAMAVQEIERARELDPLCLTVGTSAAWVNYVAGDIPAALGCCRFTLDMDPEFGAARRLLGAALLAAGRTDDAVAHLQTAADGLAEDPVALSWLAHARAQAGARADAMALVDRVRGLAATRYVSSYHLAMPLAALGEYDRAFAALDDAWVDRDPALSHVAVEPRFEPLRADARFDALLGRLQMRAAGAGVTASTRV